MRLVLRWIIHHGRCTKGKIETCREYPQTERSSGVGRSLTTRQKVRPALTERHTWHRIGGGGTQIWESVMATPNFCWAAKFEGATRCGVLWVVEHRTRREASYLGGNVEDVFIWKLDRQKLGSQDGEEWSATTKRIPDGSPTGGYPHYRLSSL
jgi:hypothetical protein